MDVSLLQSVVRFHIGSTALRILVVGAAVWWGIALAELPGVPFRALRSLDRRRVLLAAGALRPAGAGGPRVPDVGDRQDPVHPVGHRHPLRSISSPSSSARCWRSTCSSRPRCRCDRHGSHRSLPPVRQRPPGRAGRGLGADRLRSVRAGLPVVVLRRGPRGPRGRPVPRVPGGATSTCGRTSTPSSG